MVPVASARRRHHQPEDVVAPHRIARDREHVAVIGGDEDQRLAGISVVDRILHRAGELDRFLQRVSRAAFVVGVIDPPALDHQVIALLRPLQPRDRLRRHVGEGRLG